MRQERTAIVGHAQNELQRGPSHTELVSYPFDKLTPTANRRRWGCEIGTPQSVTATILRSEGGRTL